jgi:hypothetical protein
MEGKVDKRRRREQGKRWEEGSSKYRLVSRQALSLDLVHVLIEVDLG